MTGLLRSARPRSVLLTGGKGRLAHAVGPAFERAGWDVRAVGHAELDITRPDEVLSALRSLRPTAVVNLAAWTDADACERDPERAELVNASAVGALARACAEVDAHLCHVSSDYVFDGTKRAPYRETDLPNPLSAYGRSKLAGERAAGPTATIIRVAWLSGEHGRSFVRTVLDQAANADAPLRYVADQVGSPTNTHDVARVLVALVADRHPGVVHAANTGAASCYDAARHVLDAARLDPDRVESITTGDLQPVRAAARPSYSVLDNRALRGATGTDLPAWQDAISRLVSGLVADVGGRLARLG